ncbi:MAG: lysostaphin resistance A-like protein [Candidatus Tyrphobacter sp.]
MRALAILIELWTASEIILLAQRMGGDALLYAVLGIFLLGCCFFTYRVTFPPRSAPDGPVTRNLLPIQILATLAIVALTGWTIALDAHAASRAAPIWHAIHAGLVASVSAIAPHGLSPALVDFGEYAVLPLVVLVVLRVPLRRMGLGGFTPGSARAAAIWLVLPLFAIAYVILYADTSAATVGRRFIFSFLASGFSEEFLFRGALFGRLRSFMPAQWAAFLQALVFGLWHLGTDFAQAHTLVSAYALVVPAQAAFGFAMAILVRRTGNLAIPVLLHTTIATIRSVMSAPG